jgi:hypothetical protein
VQEKNTIFMGEEILGEEIIGEAPHPYNFVTHEGKTTRGDVLKANALYTVTYIHF